MTFETTTFRPGVRPVMMIGVTEDKRLVAPVYDDPQIAPGPNGPESFVSRAIETMKTEARMRGIHLQIVCRSFRRFLVGGGESSDTPHKGVGKHERHG
jgi:hypothetical protein